MGSSSANANEIVGPGDSGRVIFGGGGGGGAPQALPGFSGCTGEAAAARREDFVHPPEQWKLRAERLEAVIERLKDVSETFRTAVIEAIQEEDRHPRHRSPGWWML